MQAVTGDTWQGFQSSSRMKCFCFLDDVWMSWLMVSCGYLEVRCSRFVEWRNWIYNIWWSYVKKLGCLLYKLLVYIARLLCSCNLHQFLLVFARSRSPHHKKHKHSQHHSREKEQPDKSADSSSVIKTVGDSSSCDKKHTTLHWNNIHLFFSTYVVCVNTCIVL